jgi:hypothetical protein
MAPTPKRYGSISSDEQDVEVELLPTGEAYIGTVDDEIGSNNKTTHRYWHRNRRHHCLSYTLTALTCLFAAHYWHNRAQSYNNAGENNGQHSSSSSNNNIVHSRSGRVPMPPALSTLDPAIDLGFRSTTRSGLALPSKAWGEHSSKFAALPTNEWYLVSEFYMTMLGSLIIICANLNLYISCVGTLLFALHHLESPLARGSI